MQETGGVDSYTNAISDTYQDNFGEGIYTGKGIYDLEVFEKVMKGKIPENTVLSHDLLEGSILRCGLGSDIMLLDGFPTSFPSYITREERWVRGDWQIIPFLKEKYLNKLSKFKIIDNLRRSLIEIFCMLNLLFLSILKNFANIKIWPIVLITFCALTIPTILDILNYIIFRKENIKVQRKFGKKIEGISSSIYRGIVQIMTLPSKAYIVLKAITKTIYRMKVTKEHLLEWQTSEEAEKKSKKDLLSMYKLMLPNVIASVIFIVRFFFTLEILAKIFLGLISLIWLISPYIMYNISKPKEEKKKLLELNSGEIDYINRIAENTWGYFLDFMNKENNYLPPDNFQESRKEKVVSRTSSTNIGLGLMTIISAYDLKFIPLEKAITLIENVINTIQDLEKWNGHLYNWYNTKTLKPLIPRYISTVDSGNFVRISLYIKRLFA